MVTHWEDNLEILTIDNIQIAFRRYGNPAEKSIVLLHGMAETSVYFWDHLLDFLTPNYDVIAIDLLGHGDSSKPYSGLKYRPHKQANLYVKLLEQLNITDFVVVGHSIGGIIACQIAVDHPKRVSKLILYDTPIPRGVFGNFQLLQHMDLLAVLVIAPLVIPGLGLLMELLTPIWLRKILIRNILTIWRVPINKKNFTHEFATQAVRNSFFALEQSMRTLVVFNNLESRLHRIRIPTLILIGENDALLSVDRTEKLFKKHLTKGEVRVIAEAGHIALIDQPDVFWTHFESFLL